MICTRVGQVFKEGGLELAHRVKEQARTTPPSTRKAAPRAGGLDGSWHDRPSKNILNL